jgi:acetyltransferase-like isoleucine patch superfamily enzyme
MDKHSFCGYNCDIIYCEIGSFCSISNNVKIGGGMHPMEWVSTSPVFYKGRDSVKAKFSEFERESNQIVRIGNDVWIAANVKIKQGVTIGDGAILATECFVTKDVPPYALVGGNPAKIIKYRFTEEQIKDLLEIKWWNWEDEKIKKIVPLLVEAIKQLKKELDELKCKR